MIETEDYWITDNKFVFKPQFNDYIDKYNELIRNHNTLIFSNYNNLNICLEKNNLEDIHNNNYKNSKFNKLIVLLNNLTHLTFGANFNKRVLLPNSLTYLKFGWNFDQPVLLPDSLTHLTFGHNFNHIVSLPVNLNPFNFWLLF
jgi:hypothetical protein